jgi:uncharacterized protein involved in tellurium resistance
MAGFNHQVHRELDLRIGCELYDGKALIIERIGDEHDHPDASIPFKDRQGPASSGDDQAGARVAS